MQEVVSAKAPEEAETFVLPRVDMEKVHKREARAVEVCDNSLRFFRGQTSTTFPFIYMMLQSFPSPRSREELDARWARGI